MELHKGFTVHLFTFFDAQMCLHNSLGYIHSEESTVATAYKSGRVWKKSEIEKRSERLIELFENSSFRCIEVPIVKHRVCATDRRQSAAAAAQAHQCLKIFVWGFFLNFLAIFILLMDSCFSCSENTNLDSMTEH